LTDDGYKYDVFLSFNDADATVVREVAVGLRSEGLRVSYIDHASRTPIELAYDIDTALDQSRVMLLFMSRNSLSDQWSQLEKRSFKFRDPANKERRFVPVRLDETVIPANLRQVEFIEWPNDNPEAVLSRLVAICKPPLAKPTSRGIGAVRTSPKKRYKMAPTALVRTLEFSTEGNTAVYGTRSGDICQIDIERPATVTQRFAGHQGAIFFLDIHKSKPLLLSASDDRTVRVWDLRTGNCIKSFPESSGPVTAIRFAGDAIVSCVKGEAIHVWDSEQSVVSRDLRGHIGDVHAVAVAGGSVVSAGEDGTIRIWNLRTGQCLRVLEGHTGVVRSLAPTKSGAFLLSGSDDCTVRLWDLNSGLCVNTFDAHTDAIRHLSWHADEHLFVSAGDDRDMRLWSIDSGKLITVMDGNNHDLRGVSFSHDYVFGADSDTMYEWKIPSTLLPKPNRLPTKDYTKAPEQIQYTNAKVLLVGDSGSGKTGLSKRLVDGNWEPSAASTVGAWATQWSIPADSGENGDREIWLWDFGGQADQRLIHQLYMDETALAVLVFDAQKSHIFESLVQWDRDLSRSTEKPISKILVAGRVDASPVRVSRQDIDEYVQEHGFTRYMETSALTGKGCTELRGAIVDSIEWGNIPWRSSPVLFKRLKEEIVKLKDEGRVLMRFNELRDALRIRLPSGEINFADAELKAVLSLLTGPGVVIELEFGAWILFQPELINAYSQAVIATMRDDPSELGCVSEDRVLSGDLIYGAFQRIDPEDERFVLLAMHRKLLQRGLCARELTEKDVVLVFPSYYKRNRPELIGHPAVLVSYVFDGVVDEIYSTLVVRLDHTHQFKRKHLWQDAAEFLTNGGQKIGVKLIRQVPGGSAALEVYCDPSALIGEKIVFVKYVHDHLLQRVARVTRRRHYVCSCSHPIADLSAAERRRSDGKEDIGCPMCDARVRLVDDLELLYTSAEYQRKVRLLESVANQELDNESKERALVGDVISKFALAGQISREKSVSDHGIDMEVEFKNDDQTASGQLIFLQLKSGDSYIRTLVDGKEIFTIKNDRHAEYWANQIAPVMLVIRNSVGEIRWMEIRDYLREKRQGGKAVRQIEFKGARFDAESILKWREAILAKRVDY
jgi:small GTP-binding protein